MTIAVLKETAQGEGRVAATPDTVKKYVSMGASVQVQTGAGLGASLSDDAFTAAGATIAKDANTTVKGADVVLCVQRPDIDTLERLEKGAILVGLLSPYQFTDAVPRFERTGASAVSLELVPRITRAQSMDVLSSQANLAGYRAVIEGAAAFGRAFPMMMTAAGTVAPAKVFVMGAGVAGLQAIATARRLGAVVSATDVRPAAKEQVQSLGASFVMVENEETKAAETSGGYAKEMSEDYKRQQAALVAETIKKQDIVITTALIPGRPAPILVTEDMVKSMKPGSVIVDLAVEAGGNCPLSERGKIVEKHGVKIIGYHNLTSHIAVDASALYAKNVLNILTLMFDKEAKKFVFKFDDDIIKGVTLMHDGKPVHASLVSKDKKADAAPVAPADSKSSFKRKADTNKKED
ncbi:MAG TPA: Re/Si-specific NAD(P)(+) transhydrogenase subunit alpha [Alphaproteobacteria bacterium]